MQLTADLLAEELFSEAMQAQDHGFTMTKTLGTVEYRTDQDGNPLAEQNSSARTAVERNAAAVRLLTERFPSLQIKYPQTIVSEKTTMNDTATEHTTEIRTDAVIQVTDDFVQNHTGTAFRQLLETGWKEQLDQLLEQIVKRLRRYEMRTARMFQDDWRSLTASFRITEDMAESDIWTVLLTSCGFYPLQWDGEICGMAMLLAERLKTALADDCDTLLETSVRRDPKRKCCTVVLYYSIKQD